jgi:hypothetical protein
MTSSSSRVSREDLVGEEKAGARIAAGLNGRTGGFPLLGWTFLVAVRTTRTRISTAMTRMTRISGEEISPPDHQKTLRLWMDGAGARSRNPDPERSNPAVSVSSAEIRAPAFAGADAPRCVGALATHDG